VETPGSQVVSPAVEEEREEVVGGGGEGSMQAASTPASKLRFAIPDKESNMNTLWQEEEFEQLWSIESLMEKAAEIGKNISLKEHERPGESHDFDPKMFCKNHFWNRRPDAIVINKNHRTLYILEFKQSSD